MSKYLHGEKGFTLIELMIVILIIAILVAIAIPVFLAAKKNAQTRTCQANMRTIDGAVNTYCAQYEAYPPAGAVSAELGPSFLKRNPTCPGATPAAYTLSSVSGDVTGINPPYVSCPSVGTVTDHTI
ncbi:MAG: hypothetical protein CVT63_01745 [Candidatus Anoxymicrobium japonicum]|uniref:Prepilin-type N-terminal cleavage/methylation domain-containing protein n=1 Tax=Candidatus Anoxymicrobium japonicum TaxID=2013648 RepID=A0A2N3G7G9_9ACTN|nr:MAG: hypothetical protein CVT63_01745 [Candidatus Anoxymicrobium japonicum]